MLKSPSKNKFLAPLLIGLTLGLNAYATPSNHYVFGGDHTVNTKEISQNQQPLEKSGFYIGGNLGMGTVGIKRLLLDPNDGNPQDKISESFDSKYRFVWSVFIGYLHTISRHWSLGLELGYDNNGESTLFFPSDLGTISYYSSDIDLLGVTQYAISSHFYVFLKAGVAHVSEHEKMKIYGLQLQSKTHNDNVPKVVIGGGYDLSHNLSFTLEYDHIFSKGHSQEDDIVNDQNHPVSSIFGHELKGIASTNAIKAGIVYTLPM